MCEGNIETLKEIRVHCEQNGVLLIYKEPQALVFKPGIMGERDSTAK